MSDSQILTIGQVSARTGLSADTLRFYEREGILADPVRRGPGGRRVYAEHDVDWLNLCIVLRSSGMSIPAIRRYTELARQGAGTEADRLSLLHEHQEKIFAQFAELHRCLDVINHKIAVYEDYLDRPADDRQDPPAGCGQAEDDGGVRGGRPPR